jgi:hypothetical protein
VNVREAAAGTKLGVQAVDIGLPALARGAARLTAAIGNVEAVVRLLTMVRPDYNDVSFRL